MAYYWGKFRTIDTSQDPLGQEYKVVIFTQYDGTTSPYRFSLLTDEPIEGIELTMAAQPFTVNYTSDDDTIYKPYKCSTATVRFMLGNYNPELFSNNNTNIMVALLRRNNYIQQQGDNYVDTRTNQVVIRKRYYGLWYGFLPSEVDTHCYDVEWIGYAMAQTYNQGYALVEEPFELECQDAFSTLKYDGLPFNNLVEIRDVKTLINLIVGQLGTYRRVYYPANLVLPNPATSGEEDGTAFNRIIQQYRNFISDDDEPISKMELVDAIGNFLNVSFVPWKDSIYIVNYEGVAAGYPYYYRYELDPNNNLWFNYRTDNPQWGDSVLTDMSSDLALTQECYASSDTNLTMQPVFSNFRVKCDEQEADLMPDLADSKNYYRLTTCATSEGLFSELISSPRYYTGVRWDRGIIGELQEVNGIGFRSYIYDASYIDSDNIPHDHYTPVHPSITPNLFLAKYIATDPLTHWTGCVVLKNSVVKGTESRDASAWFASKDKTTLYNSCFQNEIVFWGTNRFEWADVSRSSYNSWWSENHQTVFSYTSPKLIVHESKAISIKGDWLFFRNNGFMSLPQTENRGCTVDRSHLYVTGKITINISDGTHNYTYTVRKNEQDEYYLSAGEYRCDLALDDSNYDENKPFGQTFKFKDSIGDGSGLIIPIPSSLYNGGTEVIVDFTIELMKPFGVAIDGNMPKFCNSAILRNFSVDIADVDQIQTWGYGEATTDFHNKLNKNLETMEVDNNLSTNQYTSKLTYNYAFKVCNGHYNLLDNLGNTATGIIARPEVLKLADIYNQYRDKTIGLDTTVWHNLGIQPNTRVKWNNRSMIVDSREIDFEMNRETVRLIEKKLRGDVPELEAKMYLENENGQTINLNPFYDEQFNPQTVDSYTRNGSMVHGYASDGTQVNAAIMFWPSWTEGICANVSIPDALDSITVGINNIGELFIMD